MISFHVSNSSSHAGSLGRLSLSPWRLSWVAMVLLGLCATILIGAALSGQLADSSWQLRLSNAVVHASCFPLVGQALLHLAADLNPSSETLALGFVLLIPLQGFLLLQHCNNITTAQINPLERSQRTIAALR